MADVTSYTQAGVDALVAGAVVGASIDGSDNLTLTTHDGTSIPVGSVGGTVPFATETVSGILPIATTAEVTAGTDNSAAVTSSKLKAVTNALTTTDGTKQEYPQLYNGSAYAAATGAKIFVGGTPSGTIPNGSIWFDTSV